jgi:hypothetical protein
MVDQLSERRILSGFLNGTIIVECLGEKESFVFGLNVGVGRG